MLPHDPEDLSPTWLGLVDDAAVFPPGNVALPEAIAAWSARRTEWYAGFVRSFVLRDTELPLVRGLEADLTVVVTGGAGQIAGPLGLARRLGLAVTGLEIALRDPDDLAGNARRVVAALDAARAEGVLDEDDPVFVELPRQEISASWLTAADEVANGRAAPEVPHRRHRGRHVPDRRRAGPLVDAALDRETPFKCTGGLHQAVRHRDPATGFEHHGFLNLLVATQHLFDGGSADEAVAILDRADAATVVAAARDTALDRARRWFTSFGSCSVTEPLDVAGRDRPAGGRVSTHLGGRRRRLAVRRGPPAVRRLRTRR